jgi:hypothetical protein
MTRPGEAAKPEGAPAIHAVPAAAAERRAEPPVSEAERRRPAALAR